ncbi:hypothetical protein TNCT_258141 [Trichonephila clavata]|uniref:Uncharacterized protein n=1 Tax=Trichonephila clavata TaxID=2740835 RepID=A0A8X6GSY8_TRICU|nr:hypothetical protein TNCT_258141 [Trichonephila clavata]
MLLADRMSYDVGDAYRFLVLIYIFSFFSENGSHSTIQFRRRRPHQIVRPLVRAGPGRLHACPAYRLLLHAPETRLLRNPALLLYAHPSRVCSLWTKLSSPIVDP